MSELLILLGKIGFLVLLWLFVLLCAHVIKSDMFGKTVAAEPRAALDEARAAKAAKATKTSRGRDDRRGRKKRGAPRAVMVAEGRQLGQEFPLAGEVVIGRSTDSAFVIDDDYSSGHHAVIRRHPSGEWFVEDLGSTNGTFLNETRITQPTIMTIGDQLRIGRTVMKMVM